MRSVFGVLALAALTSAAPYNTQVVPNNYIVVFKENVPKASVEAVKSNIAQQQAMSASSFRGPKSSFHIGGFKGFSGEFDAKTIQKLRSNPNVAYIEQDGVVHTMGTQVDAPWGLTRISHDKLEGVPEKPTTFGNYDFDDAAQGEGVNVYVLDTGVFIKHEDFEDRATFAKNFADDGKDEDCNGHGTHCAGTIAGKTYGVAKKASIIGVKVLDCGGSGTYAGVIAGIDWVANEHDKTKKCVASMSLGGGKNAAVNKAVDAATAAGCFFAIAAGNENQDANNVSPASAPSSITVGSINWKDARSSFSNWGTALTVFAPGENVLSAWIGKTNNGTNAISGTSMATPHVAGHIATLLSKADNTISTVDEMKKWLKNKANSLEGLVQNPRTGSPNFIIRNGANKSGGGEGGEEGGEEGETQ